MRPSENKWKSLCSWEAQHTCSKVLNKLREKRQVVGGMVPFLLPSCCECLWSPGAEASQELSGQRVGASKLSGLQPRLQALQASSSSARAPVEQTPRCEWIATPTPHQIPTLKPWSPGPHHATLFGHSPLKGLLRLNEVIGAGPNPI